MEKKKRKKKEQVEAKWKQFLHAVIWNQMGAKCIELIIITNSQEQYHRMTQLSHKIVHVICAHLAESKL